MIRKRPKIAKTRGRNAVEWIGKTPDERPPRRVVLRIFDRANGKCHITGSKIRPGDVWDVEHVLALEDGGENRESNMAPALRYPHRKKTAQEAADRAKVRKKQATHLGLKEPSKTPIKSRGFAKSRKEPKASQPIDKFSSLGPSRIARQFGVK